MPAAPEKGNGAMFSIIGDYNLAAVPFPKRCPSIFPDDQKISIYTETIIIELTCMRNNRIPLRRMRCMSWNQDSFNVPVQCAKNILRYLSTRCSEEVERGRG